MSVRECVCVHRCMSANVCVSALYVCLYASVVYMKNLCHLSWQVLKLKTFEANCQSTELTLTVLGQNWVDLGRVLACSYTTELTLAMLWHVPTQLSWPWLCWGHFPTWLSWPWLCLGMFPHNWVELCCGMFSHNWVDPGCVVVCSHTTQSTLAVLWHVSIQLSWLCAYCTLNISAI